MSPPRGVLFTDLDGTLLDFETYRPSPQAVAALEDLKRADIVVIPVSSKTADEVRPLLHELGLPGPAVAEGGAVLLRVDGTVDVVGPPRSELVAVLERLTADGWPLRGFSAMDVGEVSRITGLDAAAALRAMNRLASEPFCTMRTLVEQEPGELQAAVAALNAAVVRGGRLWHLMGTGVDKATGMRRVQAIIGGSGVPTAALGDAWNDLPMLAAADLGFLLGDRVEGPSFPEGVVRLPAVGPSGFADGVRRVLGAWED
jgi:mannosyl-3-phosphoglycerate phosphatase